MNTTTHITEALAAKLINLAADYLEAGSAQNETACARLDGACIAANALGYGSTPFYANMTACEWVRANPRPGAGAAYPDARKAWAAVGAATVGRALFNVGPDVVYPQCPVCGGWAIHGCGC